MKKIHFFVFIITFIHATSFSLYASPQFSESSITILYRFYCINRLTKMVNTLFQLERTLEKQGKIDTFSKKKYIQLKHLWQDFVVYKKLDDHESVHKIIEYIFLFSQTVSSKQTIHGFSLTNKTQLTQELDAHIEINEILLRFYYLKRLLPLINFLQVLENKKIIPFDNISIIEMRKLYIETTPVLYAINALQQNHTFQEFFVLWDILNQYIYLKDTRIIAEYTRSLYYIFFITIKHLSCENNIMYKYEKSLNIEQLQNMPLEDMFSLLDIMVKELPYFLEKTELNSTLTWKEWCKKYWLIAPISALILSIRIYMIHKGALHHTNTHNQPQNTTETIKPIV